MIFVAIPFPVFREGNFCIYPSGGANLGMRYKMQMHGPISIIVYNPL